MGINLGSIAKIGGGIVGAYFGGPIGATIGAKAGETVGNVLSSDKKNNETASNNSNPLNLLGGLTGGQNGSTDLLGSALNIFA